MNLKSHKESQNLQLKRKIVWEIPPQGGDAIEDQGGGKHTVVSVIEDRWQRGEPGCHYQGTGCCTLSEISIEVTWSVLTWGSLNCFPHTGCPKKNDLLSLKAYNFGLEAAIWASRDSFGILRLWAFIWDQELQDYVKASLRKMCLKLATLKTWHYCITDIHS